MRIMHFDTLVEMDVTARHVGSDDPSGFRKRSGGDVGAFKLPSIRVQQDVDSVTQVEIKSRHGSAPGRERLRLSAAGAQSNRGDVPS